MGRLESTPPGTVLTLLETYGGLFERFTFTRPTFTRADRCGVCHRRHTRRRPLALLCGRCGALLHDGCWERIATAAEIHTYLKTWENFAFICGRCRS